MSLYNMLFKRNKNAKEILQGISLEPQFFDRFRDVDVIISGESMKVIVATRTGGPNREDHIHNIQAIRHHPLFLADYDDTYDETYAYFELKVPEDKKEVLEQYAKDEVLTIGQKFNNLIHKMNNDPEHEDAQHAMSVGKKIIDQIEEKIGASLK